MNIILREDVEPKSDEIVEKEEEYMAYIKKHIALVQKAYVDLFVNNNDLHIPDFDDTVLRQTILNLAPEIENHDASKYSDEEFYGYREKFYPTEYEKEKYNSDPGYKDYVDNKMNEAWVHHHKVNDHHPLYWKWENDHFSDDNVPRDMSLGAIIHMICDWQAMSWNSHNSVTDWYDNSAQDEKAAMNDRTKAIVEEFLTALYGWSKSDEE